MNQGRTLFEVLPSMRNTVILLIDGGIAITSFWSAVLLRTNFTAQVFTFRELVVYSLLVVGAAVAMAEITGWLHRSWRFLVASTIVHAMIFSAFVVSLATVLIFLYDRLVLLPRSVPVLFYSLFFAWILLPRILYGCWRSRCRRNGGPSVRRHERPLLLAGGGPLTALLADWLARDPGPRPWYPVGILDEDLAVGRRLGTVPVLGRIADFRRVLGFLRARGEKPERILIARRAEELPREALRSLQKAAYAEGIPVTFLDRLLEMGTVVAREDVSPETCTVAYPVSSWLAVRGPLDVLAAVMGLLLLAPLLLTAAVLVLVTKGRPVLFVQVRPGRNGERLRIFKLRTMHDLVAADGKMAPPEHRLSAVGRWLRRFRIDELFQLLNVVRGEMALIGPRPLIAEDLERMPDKGRGRFLVRPGVTGWAQVNGGNRLEFREKYAMDMWYIAHASPWLDLRIVWKTLVMMSRGERRDERAIATALAWHEDLAPPFVHGGLAGDGLEEVA